MVSSGIFDYTRNSQLDQSEFFKKYLDANNLNSLWNSLIGNPSSKTSQTYAATVPPGFTTLFISAKPTAGSGTKNSTNAITPVIKM